MWGSVGRAMTNATSSGESDECAAPTTGGATAGGAPGVLRVLYWYRLPLSILLENVTALLALIYLVGWHGVSRTDLVIFSAMYVLGMLGVEVGLHRYFSHRAFEATPSLRAGLAILGGMAGQGSVLAWAVNHRKHHRFADRDADPHSPTPRGAGVAGTLGGLWHAHFGWYFSAPAAVSFDDLRRYARDLLTDRRLMGVDAHVWSWVALGMLVPGAAGLLLTRTWGGALTALLWGGPIRMLFVDNVTWAVNSLAHTYGETPFPNRDRSTNLGWLAVPSLGASWHNNHHAFPASARVSLERHQIDPGFWCIRLFERLGLASAVQVARPRDGAPGSAIP